MTDLPSLAFGGDASRDADELLRLQECSAEPIRTIGRIQSHGALFGVDVETGLVVVASENVEHWLGRDLHEAGSETLLWALRHGVAVDPVRAEFEGAAYDVIPHPDTTPRLLELEPVVPGLDYVRTGVVGAIQRLAGVSDPDELRRQAAREIKAITGYDRVMCYHFHDDGHGQVVADEREPEMESYYGLHFPASDIPVQARALYIEKRSRVIADTEDPGLPLHTLLPDEAPIDLGPAELRASSPHHLQFMRNMGQVSTVSFGIVIGDHLVGMFTCAHRTPRRIPVLLRRALEVLATHVATQLTSAEQIRRLSRQLEVRERRTALTAPIYGRTDVGSVLMSGERTVLDIVPADGALLRLDGTVTTVGVVPPPGRLFAVVDELGSGRFLWEALPLERPELAVEIPGVTGLLVVPLGADGDVLVFVRGEVARTVDWLGEQRPENRDSPLSPRRSFSAWSQSVTGRSLPWGEHAQDAYDLGEDIRAAMIARAQAELAELALRDALTGLHNRRFLHDRLEDLLDASDKAVAVVFLDLDDFKLVNDTYGHEVGDAVLAAIGRRLSGVARASDVVVRLGGDEFIIVCVDAGPAEAAAVAGRALASITEPIVVRDTEIRVKASAGVVTAERGNAPGDLLDAADAAMYRAKRGGGGRVSA
ncbi:bifunctional diguanylate cyclase/phosphodiesterase [Microbacterium kyungheense]|uniref:Diguanylate cyclase (GGDEF)-like protein n=1 Tax=Microbacterium kyungheense TaxID=1263636 RepID=A0A543EQ21_9MICO|nr:sensor domain-containing diguanylate cyclase [Microbacterium kyungheense]TQM23675.1 diguanylate cyclase (GGDEF)-like protein [Microbacterium kyungheense]